MKNLMRSSIFPGVCIVAAVAATFAVLYVINLGKNSAASVEVGLAELSPKGEDGGYGVPASGSSAAQFSVKLSPTSVKQGNNAQIRWDWSTTNSSEITRVTIFRCNQSGRTLRNCSSWTEVMRMNGKDFGGGSTKFKCFWFLTCTTVNVKGPSPWYNAKSSGLAAGTYVYRGDALFLGRPDVTAAASLTVTGIPVPTTYPDLTAVNLSHSPATVRVGDTVTIQGQIRNSGAADAGASTANICINGSDCINRGVSGLTKNGGTSAVLSRTWTPSAAGTYTVRLCGDSGGVISESNESNNCGTGSVASYTVTVSPRPANPAATLEIRNTTTNGAWTTASPFTIIAGQDVALRWSSSNATSCNGSASNGSFSTGGTTSGTQSSITEPAAGGSTTYTVQCNDNDGSTPAASDQIRVDASVALPSLSASATTVRTNEPFTLSWNLNGNVPALCVITGPGSTRSSLGSITSQTGSMTIDAVGTATYVLDCPGGDDEQSITVLPEIYES